MRKLKNRPTNFFYFVYRMISPVLDPIQIVMGIYGYIWFTADLIRYKIMSPESRLVNINLFPKLHEKTAFTLFDAHYFHQQLWAFEGILKAKPALHVDIASSYHFSGYVAKVCKSQFVDIRPIQTELKNLEVIKADMLFLPYEDNSLESISCLHVAEHVGLGRYGDKLDPQGTVKACKEMARVLKPGGTLYFTLPTGKDRICFNAHRVHSPKTMLSYFKDLELEEFSVVDDNDKLIINADPKDYNDVAYACGMYRFTKKS